MLEEGNPYEIKKKENNTKGSRHPEAVLSF